MQKEKKILYFNTSDRYASIEFGDSLYQLLCKEVVSRPLVFLCIGSDRATGDCLGPLLGHRLDAVLRNSPYFVYGTLKEPVHAKNLKETIDKIYHIHENPLIVAIDASLGRSSPRRILHTWGGTASTGRGGGQATSHCGRLLYYRYCQYLRLARPNAFADYKAAYGNVAI